MRLLLLFAALAIGVSFLSTRADDVFDRGGGSPKASISELNDLLERAASGKPLDGRPAPDPRWLRRMNAACAKREQGLAALPPATTVGRIQRRGAGILRAHRAFAARVASLTPPAAWNAEARELDAVNARQERVLERVVAAARAGDLARAMRRAVALRELAGRANAVFLRLGLPRCAFGASGMPV